MSQSQPVGVHGQNVQPTVQGDQPVPAQPAHPVAQGVQPEAARQFSGQAAHTMVQGFQPMVVHQVPGQTGYATVQGVQPMVLQQVPGQSVYPVVQSVQPVAVQQIFSQATHPQVQYINGQPVLIQTVRASNPQVWERYKGRASISLGSMQLAIGTLLILLNIIGLIVDRSYHRAIFLVGHGFWCGVLYMIAGGFGVGAGKNRTTCVIVTTMVMSIMSAMFALCVTVVCASVGVGSEAHNLHDYYYDYYGMYDSPAMMHYSRGSKGVLAIHCLMLILGLVELIVATVASALCCATVCCCRSPQTGAAWQPAPTMIQLQTLPQAALTTLPTTQCTPSFQTPTHAAQAPMYADLPPAYGAANPVNTTKE